MSALTITAGKAFVATPRLPVANAAAGATAASPGQVKTCCARSAAARTRAHSATSLEKPSLVGDGDGGIAAPSTGPLSASPNPCVHPARDDARDATSRPLVRLAMPEEGGDATACGRGRTPRGLATDRRVSDEARRRAAVHGLRAARTRASPRGRTGVGAEVDAGAATRGARAARMAGARGEMARGVRRMFVFEKGPSCSPRLVQGVRFAPSVTKCSYRTAGKQIVVLTGRLWTPNPHVFGCHVKKLDDTATYASRRPQHGEHVAPRRDARDRARARRAACRTRTRGASGPRLPRRGRVPLGSPGARRVPLGRGRGRAVARRPPRRWRSW